MAVQKFKDEDIKEAYGKLKKDLRIIKVLAIIAGISLFGTIIFRMFKCDIIAGILGVLFFMSIMAVFILPFYMLPHCIDWVREAKGQEPLGLIIIIFLGLITFGLFPLIAGILSFFELRKLYNEIINSEKE